MRSVTRKRCGEADGNAATVCTVMRGGTSGGFFAAITSWAGCVRKPASTHIAIKRRMSLSVRAMHARPMMRQPPPSFTRLNSSLVGRYPHRSVGVAPF